LSVAPGETIRFMVSAEVPRYRASLVRLIVGDEHPSGPGYRESAVASAIDGEHDGRRQPLLCDNNVARMTHNVLRRFVDPRPFDLP
jgi:hypothetical protein